jgi:hypothetical protein
MTQKINTCAYNWHEARFKINGETTTINIYFCAPHASELQLITSLEFTTQKDAFLFLKNECKGRNISAARKFLQTQPRIFMRIFVYSLNETFLSVNSILEDQKIFSPISKISEKRATAILKILERWGIIWQFSPGEYCNRIQLSN